MKKCFQCLAGIICLCALMVCLVGCRDDDDTLVIKLGHSLDITHPVHKAMEFMRDRLEEESGGTITVDIFPNEQLGSEREMIELVQLGIIDMTKTSTALMENFVPEMSVFGIPYVFRSNEHMWEVLEGPVGAHVKQLGEPVKIFGLCYYDSGSRSFYTKDTPIHKPADLQGLKIRVQQSPTAIEMVKALGGSPTPIAWGELYTSLQQGVVDGAENNPPSFETSRHFEVCKYYTLDEHTRVPDIVIMNSDFWKKLTEDQRELIQKIASESSVYQRKLWEEKTNQSLAIVRGGGVEIIIPDKQPFIDAVAEMHASYAGTAVGELLEQIKQTGK